MKKTLHLSIALLTLIGVSSWARRDDHNSYQGIMYVAGSTHKICQVTGETDKEFGTPTASQTETRYGLVGADLGYSFEHDGKLFFLFGDAQPAKSFNGHPNGRSDFPRDPSYDDAIGFTSLDDLSTCPKLDFTTDLYGAYKSPKVDPITLRTNEMPISGISERGRMYVIFGTDNPYSNPPFIGPPPFTGIQDLGAGPTRTVIAVSDDDANSWHYLYDFSKSNLTSVPPYDAKFIYTDMARGDDGYIYIWGSEGGLKFRQSRPYLARKKADNMDIPDEMEYFTGTGDDGNPRFSHTESDAAPLFLDYDGTNFKQTDCMAHKGVEWNRFVERWVMLYDCTNATPLNDSGIYMRTAKHPWGPWSDPQTIFNAKRDHGECVFIFSSSTGPCPNPGGQTAAGGNYAPYFIQPLTVGDREKGTSTFFWTMATFDPYTQMIMETKIQGSSDKDK